MEETQCDDAGNTVWSSATNWSIAGGSLLNSVAFESFFSPINDEIQSTAGSAPKSPLILRPYSPDSGPCEITISFATKHEVQQVYVRSTARVYEIYYGTDLQSDNEYLCTVRCDVAPGGVEVLETTDSEEVFPAHLKDPSGDSEGNLKGGSNSSATEDDWVKVKVPECSVFDNNNTSLPLKYSTDSEKITQDLYEATAEITDANPCTFLTLRLLSLRSKGYLCIDEVYVFGNPVDSSDSEKEEGKVANSTGSSLMTMLVPTLLQLSKTASVSRIQERHACDTDGSYKLSKMRPKVTDSTRIPEEGKSCGLDDEKVKLENANETNADPGQSQIPLQVPAKDSKHDCSQLGHIESTLNQLVYRMARLETFFMRFEENMVKAINSSETRLELVEQQLEILNKKSESSGLPSCTRIFAPEFSCNESDSSPFHNSGRIESDNKEFNSDIPLEDTSNSADASYLLPSLVVTAPEFSNGDDEDLSRSVESVRDSSNEKPKPVMSIDDVLASALAGFVSSTSVQSPYFSLTLSVKAPEFSNEEDDNRDRLFPSKAESEKAAKQLGCSRESVGTEAEQGFASSYLSSESGVNLTRPPTDDHSAKTTCALAECMEETEEIESGEVKNGISDFQVLENSDISDQSLENQTYCSDTTTETGAIEVTKEESAVDIVQNVLGFSRVSSSVVDFEIPVLDVKFMSLENSNSKHSLQALFGDAVAAEPNTEAPWAKETGDDSLNSEIGNDSNFILVEEEELIGPATNDPFSVDMDYGNIMDEPQPLGQKGENMSDNGENMSDNNVRRSHEIFPVSLI